MAQHKPAPAVEAPLALTAQAANPAVNRGGALCLQAIETVPAEAVGPHHLIEHDQPFSIQLRFDFTGVTSLNSHPFSYTASVYAKNIGDGSHQLVSECTDTLTPQERLTLTLSAKLLLPGIYRLEAVVTLTQPPARPELMAHLEGGILQVY